MSLDRAFAETAAIHSQIGAIFVSLEISRSTWLVTSLSPGAGEKLSKHGIEAGNVSDFLARLAELRREALARAGRSYPIIVIQEAGLARSALASNQSGLNEAAIAAGAARWRDGSPV
jgi:transposase